MENCAGCYNIRLFTGEEFVCETDGYVHRKTVPFYIFAQATEGNYQLRAGDECANCPPGGAFLTRPDLSLEITHHTSPATRKMSVRYIHFYLTDSRGRDVLRNRNLPLCVAPAPADEIGDRISRLCRLDRNGNLRNTEKHFILFDILSKIFALSSERPEDALTPAWYLKATDEISQKCGQKADLAEIIRHSGLSRSKFYAEFKRLAMQTPAEYVEQARIRYAIHRKISAPEISMKELADICGWSDQFHFSRCFKRVTGQSPRLYFTASAMFQWH